MAARTGDGRASGHSVVRATIKRAEGTLRAVGDVGLAGQRLTAVFCSRRCPGDVILDTYDVIRVLRNGGTPMVGGFQTPMERECLRLLLRGRHPVVICPARGVEHMRIPRDWRPGLEEGRILILSPFPAEVRRPTANLAAQRNDLVAALAERVFIAHAAPGGQTESFARKVAASGKPLLTLDSPANANLFALGAQVIREES